MVISLSLSGEIEETAKPVGDDKDNEYELYDHDCCVLHLVPFLQPSFDPAQPEDA